MIKVLKGRISIGRSYGGAREDEPVSIRVEDQLSGLEVISIRMTLEDFATALMGQGFIPCTFDYNDTKRIGMHREVKTELVKFNCYRDRPSRQVNASNYAEVEEEYLRSKLAPFEVDGWSGRTYDLTNGHNIVTIDGESYQKVGFMRFVNEKGEPLL